MSFREPVMLAGLILIPLAALAYLSMQRRRRPEAAAFANPALLPNLVTARPGWRRHVPPLLVLLALATLVIALARPQRTVAAPQRAATVMMVTDISGSMNATDVDPNRLAAARRAAAALQAEREAKGALEVESVEPEFAFSGEGHVTALVPSEQTESHRLIEHLMIAANEQVAKLLAERGVPSLYRVHEKPDPQAVEFMVAQLASLDIPTPALPHHMSPQQAAEVAAAASRLAQEEARRSGRGRWSFGSLVLRSLKQAYYTPRNVGHAGLASPRYCHFTSPIRRYPDLVAHRALLSGLGLDAVAPRAHELDDAGVEASAREREAMTIERDADDICLAFLLERVIYKAGGGEPPAFEGEIVGAVAKGVFVRFGEEGFEGFLPARALRDWYTLNEEGTALVGESSGRALRIGDPIAVTVDRVDAPRGRVDLQPSA